MKLKPNLSKANKAKEIKTSQKDKEMYRINKVHVQVIAQLGNSGGDLVKHDGLHATICKIKGKLFQNSISGQHGEMFLINEDIIKADF